MSTYESGRRLYAGSLMNKVLTNDSRIMNNNGEICIRKLVAFYNTQDASVAQVSHQDS